VIQETAALLDRHALRAYDAVQLAGCIMLRARLERHATFVCSDRQLLKADEDEGIDGARRPARPPQATSLPHSELIQLVRQRLRPLLAIQVHQALFFRRRLQNAQKLSVSQRFAIGNPNLAIRKFDLPDKPRHAGNG